MKKVFVCLLIGLGSASAWAEEELDYTKSLTEAQLMEIGKGDRDDYTSPSFSKPLSEFRLDLIAEGDRDE